MLNPFCYMWLRSGMPLDPCMNPAPYMTSFLVQPWWWPSAGAPFSGFAGQAPAGQTGGVPLTGGGAGAGALSPPISAPGIPGGAAGAPPVGGGVAGPSPGTVGRISVGAAPATGAAGGATSPPVGPAGGGAGAGGRGGSSPGVGAGGSTAGSTGASGV
jgi:hypothetical protein